MSDNIPQNGDASTIQGIQTLDMQSVDRSLAGVEAMTSSAPSSNEASPPLASKHVSTQPAHQRFVFTDPVAFRYDTTDFLLGLRTDNLVKDTSKKIP